MAALFYHGLGERGETKNMREKVGVLAGSGRLPFFVVRGIRAAGHQPVVLGLTEEVDPALAAEASDMEYVSVGRLGEIVHSLHHHDLRHLVLAGKVRKTLLFADIKIDEEFRRLLDGLPRKNDDAILGAVVDYLARAGIVVLPQAEFLSDLLAPRGVLSRRAPDAREQADILFGLTMAKAIGALDFGQSVVVKDLAVLAVEAAEGTDETIRRGGRLGRGGAVLVKVSKPQQDPRFDVPTIGPDTVACALEAVLSVLAVEAGKRFFLEREEALRAADRAGLAVVGIDEAGAY
ncbi:MAG: LpxI family protein [Firmicutes bacterium]|nr:LpxI family protein [Bacillota bacterium]